MSELEPSDKYPARGHEEPRPAYISRVVLERYPDAVFSAGPDGYVDVKLPEMGGCSFLFSLYQTDVVLLDEIFGNFDKFLPVGNIP